MNHKKHMVWMIAGMIVIFAIAQFTNASFLFALAPLFCVIMMVIMMIAMGGNHDKK